VSRDALADPGRERARTVPDTPGVIARPPLIFLSSIVLGSVLQFLWPVRVLPDTFNAILGGSLVGMGVILFVLAVREFRRAGTGIRTSEPTTTIVTSGPYQFSRNPIYLSFALLQTGLVIWVNSAWLLGTLIATLVVVRYGVVSREEAYLERKFGEEYRQYKSSVRRWF